MTIEQFEKKFEKIKKLGFVRSTRRGPTGIGHTLEDLLEIQENNFSTPDLGKIELKAHRNKNQSLITLFTFNRKVWKMPPLKAIKNFGSKDKDGRFGLYYTMSLQPNSVGLFLDVSDQEISVRHKDGDIIAVWELKTLAERFSKKIPALIFVSAFCEERNDIEYFHFYRAQLMKGTSPELLSHQFKSENIVVDLRLHDAITRARNHGTGFRVYEDKLPLLFRQIEEL